MACRFLIVMLLAFCIAPGAAAADEAAADALYRETIETLGSLELRTEQASQIRRLADRFAPDIRDAYLTAPVAQQKQARDEAIARAVAAGLRGARAREFVKNELRPTAEERAAYERATKLRREFDQAVLGVLNDDQRRALQQPENRDSARAAPASSGVMIVQLSPRLRAPPESAKTLDDAARALDLPELRGVIARSGLTAAKPAVPPALLDRLEQQGNELLNREIQRLRTYWQVDTREIGAAESAAVVDRLNALPEVEEAYLARPLREPGTCTSVAAVDNPYFSHQGYLAPAPEGIDAAAAWSVTGGQGAGVGIVDLERGWNIAHEDLDALLTLPWHGDRMPGNDHGTSVFGEIIAEDNDTGIVGAAPCVEYAGITSRYDASTGATELVHNPLLAALYFMEPGDVLLIEAQTDDGLPIETESLTYSAIRVAVLSGIVVVEPTGNGGADLDAFESNGEKILDRNSASFRDSGAILVGSSDPMHSHNRATASCYGSRVDCFGWGNYIATASRSAVPDVLDDGGGDDNRSYRSRFSGTSGAAPIVASAAVLVQGLWKSKFGTPLSSLEMRAILSDPTTGTAQGTSVSEHIGVMPNLAAIITAKGLDDEPPPPSSRTVHRPLHPPPVGTTRGALTCPPCPCGR